MDDRRLFNKRQLITERRQEVFAITFGNHKRNRLS
jgi:hypothetical protein